MATQTSIFIPGETHRITALAAITASAEQTYSKNHLFALVATRDITITFGAAGQVPTPSATVGMLIPAGFIAQYDLGDWNSAFKVFNADTGNTAEVYWQELKRN